MDALRKIPSLLARQRRLNALAGALRPAWWVVAGHLTVLAALGWFSLRHPLSAAWLEALGWSYVTYVLLPIFFWRAWSRPANSTAGVAADLDHANPASPDPFRTCLSLDNHDPDTLEALNRLYAAQVGSLVLPRPVFLPRAQRVLLLATLAALAIAALATGRPAEMLRRTSLPWHVLSTLPNLRFRVADAPAIAGVGDTVKVSGRVENRVAGQSLFAHVFGPAGEVRFPLAVAGDSFAFAYGPAESDFALQFTGTNGASPVLRIRVLPPPFLEKIQAVLTPPAYTGLHPDTLPEGVAHFSVLPGTRVRWSARADRALKLSVWEFRETVAATEKKPEGGERVRVDTLGTGREAGFQREVRAPLTYAYLLEDAEGIRSKPSLPFRVDITPDQPPEVEWIDAVDPTLNRDLKLPLAFRVKDDYGVTSLKLVYKILGNGGVTREGKRDCRDWLRQAAAGLVQATWDLHDLDLRPENAVEFHLVATDNDTVSGPKTGQSALRTVRLPSLQEVLAATRQQEQSAVSNLKSAIQREKQLERKLERENQQPKEELLPSLSDYEINRIMVEDPRGHLQRTDALLAQTQQTLAQKAKSGAPQSQASAAQAALAQAQAGVKEMREFLKRNEGAMPKGDQGHLPLDERAQHLDDLLQAQKEQADKLTKTLEKLAKTPAAEPFKPALDEAAKELQRNIDSQDDLKRLFKDQASQAKAKTEVAEQANQEQMRMTEDMKSALQDIQKTMEQGRKNGTLSPELMEKMKQVQDLMREVVPDSLQKLLEQKTAGQEVDAKELRDQLQKMLDSQHELSENLSRALAMLEQLRDRKRMEDIKRQLSDLQQREDKLARQIKAGEAGKPQDEDQKSIQRETQKAMGDFSAQAAAAQGAGKQDMQRMNRMLESAQVQKDMEDVHAGLSSGSPSGRNKAGAAAKSAADKLGLMAQSLGDALAAMDQSIDLGEAMEILQESQALSRLQLLIRSGGARRRAEGWEADDPALYASVAQTAQWLHERVKALAAKIPFVQTAMVIDARDMAQAARNLTDQYSLETSDECLHYNQELSRELLKLIKMAQNSGGGGGGGGGSSGQPQAGGGGQGSGDLSSQLKGMSGKQMAINSATYQLLQAMLEGRQPGSGGGKPGGESGGRSGGQGQGEGSRGGQEGDGTLPGLGNKEGELGENLESLAEGADEGGGAAQKLRKLADEARKLEDDLRQGRVTADELKRRQDRFQTRLLEAANSLEERGMSEQRQGETAKGRPAEVTDTAKAPLEGRLLQLLRQARRDARNLRLSEAQRKYLEDYYDNLLTR